MATTRQKKVIPEKDEQKESSKSVIDENSIEGKLNIKSDGTVTLTVAELLELLKSNAVLKNPEENKKLQSDDLIEVISLTPGIVNATVPGDLMHSGRVYRFESFGKTMQIPFPDLNAIVQTQSKLFEEGYLYINDARFVKAAGLQSAMENILTKEQILKIVYSDEPDYMDLFKKATSEQRRHIADILIDEINNGKEFDMNKINKISKFIGYDIKERAAKQKELLSEFASKSEEEKEE